MQYPVTISKGRFMTRNNRIVQINGSRMVDETLPNGEKIRRRLWDGMMFKADGKTEDTAHTWQDDGAFSNQRGVACPSDLVIVISREAEPVASAAAATPVPIDAHPQVSARSTFPADVIAKSARLFGKGGIGNGYALIAVCDKSDNEFRIHIPLDQVRPIVRELADQIFEADEPAELPATA